MPYASIDPQQQLHSDKEGEHQLKTRQSKILLEAIFVLLFFVVADLVVQQERNQLFAATAQKTGSALLDLAQTRAQLSQRETNESFGQYEQRIALENAETQSSYLKLYSREVARLREGFASRGMDSPELDEFYQDPGSAIAIREIGRTLFEMGAALRSKGPSDIVKGWRRALVHPKKRLA
jgi:hypothetical protein